MPLQMASDRGGRGKSAISSRLFVEKLFNQGDDRMGALLLLSEGGEPAVGGQVDVFVGARSVEGVA